MIPVTSDGTDVLWVEPETDEEVLFVDSCPREWPAVRVWNEWIARSEGRTLDWDEE